VSGGPSFAVDKPDSDKRASLTPQRALVVLLTWIRRVLGSVYQVVFRDQLSAINRQTERLGAASVESVTHLGSEVRALGSRLDAIERELVALRVALERREGESADAAEEVAARPPAS
jgi:hypothetical protein